MRRYVVATVTAREGLSAHVCDTVYLHEVVATYRSTDAAPVPGHSQRRLGKDGAIALAEPHAARLNDGS